MTGNEVTTLGQMHQQALTRLLDYDARAQKAAQGRSLQDLQATWFGLNVKIGAESVLLPQQQLAEVLSPPALTPIPGTPAWLLGLANHYGRLLPVIDVYGFIHGRAWPSISNSRVIVTDTEPSLGLVVNELGHTTRTNPPVAAAEAHIGHQPALKKWISGQTEALGKTLPVIDLTPLVSAATHWKRH